jgi:PhnB protein
MAEMKKAGKSRARPRAKKVSPSRAKTTKRRVPAVPSGYGTITPQLTVREATAALDFYKRAFGARELMRMPGPGGKIMHAELKIGDSVFFVNDEFPDMGPGPRAPQSLGGSTGVLHVYVRDVDTAFRQAVDAGAQVRMPVADMFWGDRYGKVADPFGHEWGLATHKEDLSPAEQKRRADAFARQMGQQHG